MRTALAVVAVLAALPGAVTAVHLGVLALASIFYREPRPAEPKPSRFVVMIPAHNEELVIETTLRAINAELRPGDSVIVVADRCTDATAELARREGADVVELGETPDAILSGRALARQSGIYYALGREWDAMLMIDADSVVQPGFLAACERALSSGAAALQARSEAAIGRGLVAQSMLAAFALQGVTIPRGRDRLGLLVRLRGTGMVLRRHVVEGYAFHARASEDLFYSLDLCLDGIVARHVDSARLRSENVNTWKASSGQRMRYEAGRMMAARAFLPRLLRKHSPASLDAALHLATLPFAPAVASLLAGTALAWLAGVPGLGLAGLALLAVMAGVLALGLLQTRARLSTWLALLAAPWYVPWKVWVHLRALASLRTRVAYGPTPRTRPARR